MDQIKRAFFKPKCKLIGEDGNIFFLMARASKCLKKHGFHEEAKEMMSKVTKCHSYDEALLVLDNYVEIV